MDKKNKPTVVQRNFTNSIVLERVEGDSNSIGNISGMGIVFNSYSRDLGGFFEIIEPDAIDENTDFSRCICAPDHDARKIIGRISNETLTYEKRSDGVFYTCKVNNTSDGRDVVVRVERKDIEGSSFKFRISEREWEETPEQMRKDTGVYWIHRVKKISDVLDFAPTGFAAYDDTTAERSITPPEIPTQEKESENTDSEKEVEERAKEEKEKEENEKNLIKYNKYKYV